MSALFFLGLTSWRVVPSAPHTRMKDKKVKIENAGKWAKNEHKTKTTSNTHHSSLINRYIHTTQVQVVILTQASTTTHSVLVPFKSTNLASYFKVLQSPIASNNYNIRSI
jgi:hypothetical protein